MTIEEITELSFDYASLDEEHVKFLKSTFKGATAVLVGEDGTRTAPVEELSPFDPLQSIINIPSTLKSSKVESGSAHFLEQHGLLEFKVVHDSGSPAVRTPTKDVVEESIAVGSEKARKRHTVKREEIRKFIETVSSANESRDKASNLVEEMLDNGRVGKFSSKGVEAVVDDILKQGSSPAMKAIAGLRSSDQTYAHCTDMSVILQECYVDILQRTGKKTTEANSRFALVSGFMHDIGKSEVPKDILESTERYAPDSKEMTIMRNHTTYGARILSEMGMPEPTINVAAFHHVKRDNTLLNSYPDVDYAQILPLTRLAAITDVYQALIGKRRYKKNWVPGKAIEYLLSLQGSEFDERMLGYFIKSMGRYPVGSLLKLSTGDLGFVMSVGPDEHPERPIVAIVENANGELLSAHTLLDLMLEPDITVTEVVDHYDHYSESEDQAYRIFQSIRVN
ncbi:MAG TPA: HD domain-containing phosphohydrolase [bacterium]|nr:HD domain-containing phosphohydrolase [bacterium]